jgi:hypothetical protein
MLSISKFQSRVTSRMAQASGALNSRCVSLERLKE